MRSFRSQLENKFKQNTCYFSMQYFFVFIWFSYSYGFIFPQISTGLE